MSQRSTSPVRRQAPDVPSANEPSGGPGGPTEERGLSSAGGGLAESGGAGPEQGAVPRPVGPRLERYLVAPVPAAMLPGGYAPVDAQGVVALLEADPGVTVSRVIRSRGSGDAGPLAAPPGGFEFPEVVVAEMDAERAVMLASTSQVYVEPDLPVQYTAPPPAVGMYFADPGLIPPGEEASVPFVVRGSDGTPLDGAEVYLINTMFPVRGVTGADGQVRLTVPPGSLASVRGICVKPRFDHWSIWLGNPDLSQGTPNLVTCPRLADSFPGFPGKELDSWARRAMRFDALPPTFRGFGVKIAIIDSGAGTDHPDLDGRIAGGHDILGQNNDGWRVDTVGRGSHCAGIIAGKDNGAGIVGLVPEAQIHSYKIYPSGRYSDLIDALDCCIADDIDVVTVSLGGPQHSGLVSRKIEQARQAGVACVAAAGDSAGPVAFPASLPTVLAVAATGMTGTFPPESYHATQMFGVPTTEGYFSAKFTCYGPQVDACAPGVAIVSSVPPRNYAAWDSTAFAASHVAALAAMVLAHHPDFRDRFSVRAPARVDRLFEIIRGSCRALALGDPGRTGAGLPDAVRALGLLAPIPAAPAVPPALAGLWAAMAGAGPAPVPVPVVAAAVAGPNELLAPAAGPPPGPAVFGETPTDALAPLRTALRAAGLLSPSPHPQGGTPGPAGPRG